MELSKSMTWENEDGPLRSTQCVWLDGNDWFVVTTWTVLGGRLEPVSVTVVSNDGRPVLAEVIRRLPIGTMQKEARAVAGAFAAGSNETTNPSSPLFGFYEQLGKAHRGKASSDADIALVAEVYLEAWRKGEPVTAAVKDAIGLSASAAGKRIMKARKAGLLDGVGDR